ncbi:hypothetical protein [Plantactinospora endophytica]|uniref:Uncharacterized protein n=1 Tax=Plantactinospora endophytica TaxID=673535 RepID=A0ABQ4ECB7_9ACTN|nr:hypothetical protein [Plantactinospora endophytica]GIG92381.1 hypothetical protein Pen02_73170 [Plantactinospora endophytica]
MTSPGLSTATQLPALIVISDLGKPSVLDVADYFTSIGGLWAWAWEVALDVTPDEANDLVEYQNWAVEPEQPELLATSIRLGSPLESVLTTAVDNYLPIAYSVTGIAVVERVIRLIMDWQAHRQTLSLQRREMDTQEAEEAMREAAGAELRPRRSGSSQLRRTETAIVRLARHRIIEVRREDGGEGA